MEVEKIVYYTNIHTFIEYPSVKKSALKFANSISCCCSQLIDQLKCLLRTTFIYFTFVSSNIRNYRLTDGQK